MTFETRIAGIPCQVNVLCATPYVPMRITGTGFGDAEPPEPEDFEYEILDRRGRRAPWIEAKITDSDDERIYDEYQQLSRGHDEP